MEHDFVGRSLRKELHDALAEHSVAAQQGTECLNETIDDGDVVGPDVKRAAVGGVAREDAVVGLAVPGPQLL